MDYTTRDARVLKSSGLLASEKAPSGVFSLAPKIPLIALLLFGAILLRVIYPETFHFGFKRHKSYHFNSESLGFFIGDITFFANNSYEQAEARIVGLFPDKLQTKVKKIIRPVLVLCEKHQLDPFWVLSVMWTESHFKHDSTSKKGARGLMQIMPQTYFDLLAEMKEKGIVLESDREEDFLRYHYGQAFYDLGQEKLASKLRNLEVGIYYLKGLLGSFNNNHYYATIAYNMGPFWTKSQLKNNQTIGKKNNYLEKVLKNYYHITKTLGQTSNVTFIPRI